LIPDWAEAASKDPKIMNAETPDNLSRHRLRATIMIRPL
jgi:hypothetical protein